MRCRTGTSLGAGATRSRICGAALRAAPRAGRHGVRGSRRAACGALLTMTGVVRRGSSPAKRGRGTAEGGGGGCQGRGRHLPPPPFPGSSPGIAWSPSPVNGGGSTAPRLRINTHLLVSAPCAGRMGGCVPLFRPRAKVRGVAGARRVPYRVVRKRALSKRPPRRPCPRSDPVASGDPPPRRDRRLAPPR